MRGKKKEWITFIMGTWVVFGVAFCGITFVYKVYEIVNTVPRGEMMGFAVIQVVTYLLVAMGFFFLFLWSFLRGDFSDLEASKYRILEMEERISEMERRGV